VQKKKLKNNIIDSLVERYEPLKQDVLDTLRVSGIDYDYYELACEMLGVLLNRVVWLSIDKDKKDEGEEEEGKEGGVKAGKKGILKIKKGEEFDIDSLLDLGYERVERVWNEGEISVLGDVIIIWPFSMTNLVRLSLFGSEIEDISVIDSESRKKIKQVKERTFLGANSKLLVGNEESSKTTNIKLVSNITDEVEKVDLGLRTIPGVESYISERGVVEIVKNYKRRGYNIWYLTNNIEKYDLEVVKELREMIDSLFGVRKGLERSIGKGFVSNVAKVLVLTDLEVLGQLDLSLYEERNIDMDPGSVEILKKIVPGDYVVHEDHGIGTFVKVVEKKHGPYIQIGYAGSDKLYVPLSASEKLTKYIGTGRKKPILTGLSSGVWKRISKKAKERAEDIAKELIQLYALRESAKSDVIIESGGSLKDLESFIEQFEFKDTDDQLIATKHIVEDLQSTKPMDRLLVGDVGYGKTEIAARAAFAVVNAGYQVAILAPTTILVKQHVSVFKERFRHYPVNIASLSRFSSIKEKEEVKENIQKGTVDIVIGTHALLSKNISFKKLGLLVIDEEQKFGVKQKETIKKKRVDTNVLSLTATPIPRTLNMALSGIRDISVLATPPEGRKEVINYFEKFSWDSVRDAITKELERGGQVYFLHNRVNTIEFVYSKLTKMFPHAVVGVAHGQMGVQKLSKTMSAFVDGDIDILVCTTIIENGLDIPAVNTLIIQDATMLGLSQMYQIRGRIGRSHTQAYAYFFFENLEGDAQLRLEAIKESQGLGSGFLLSNKDLEIRGAGDILGKKQSGTINSVGYGLYSQMLATAVNKLKETG
jgi:transcription-repair coupling factor (superfamily II helicase)